MANNLLVSLERLRDAFRGMRNYNCPCALPPELQNSPACPDMGDTPTVEDIRQAVERIMGSMTELPQAVLVIGSDSPLRDSFAFADPAMLGSLWITGVDMAAASYTTERALEEIRRITADGTSGEAAAYAPAEGPTSACFQCGRNVPPADLFVGKRSGIALCEPCLVKWEKAGRAKRTGEF